VGTGAAATPPLSSAFTVRVEAYFSQTRLVRAVGATDTFACEDGNGRDVPLYLGPADGFAATASAPIPRQGATLTALDFGRALLFGGEDALQTEVSDALLVYDHATGRFCGAGEGCVSGGAAARVEHTATRLADGSVLIIGGRSPSGTLAPAVLRFDPTTNAMTVVNGNGVARHRHVAVLLDGFNVPAALAGAVLVIGGQDASGAALSTAVLVRGDGSVTPATAALREARYHAAAAMLASGKVLVSGGRNSAGQLLATAELFDTATGAFVEPTLRCSASSLDHLCSKRARHTATVLDDDSVLLAGGVTAPLAGTGSTSVAAEVFDNVNERSIPVAGDLTLFDRVEHAATRIACATPPCPVLLSGGHDPSGNAAKDPFLFAPASARPAVNAVSYAGQSRPVGGVTSGALRSAHAAAPLLGGHVLLAGGADAMSGSLLQDAVVFSLCASSTLVCPTR
jgi:hypothetical protein